MMQQIQKVPKRQHINNGELYFAKNIIMSIISDNISGIGSNSTVNELVVVWVGGYEVKMIIRSNTFNKRTFQNRYNTSSAN